jgi:hypothetical protein
MGFFGTYLFDGTAWTAQEEGHEPTVPEPWLLLSIHDSDIAMIIYEPTGPGRGCAYLGFTPRTYFEEDGASEPTDVAREAKGLAAWWAERNPEATELGRAAKTRELRAFLAADGDHPNLDEDAPDDEVFAEGKAVRFLTALGLPPPGDLASWLS